MSKLAIFNSLLDIIMIAYRRRIFIKKCFLETLMEKDEKSQIYYGCICWPLNSGDTILVLSSNGGNALGPSPILPEGIDQSLDDIPAQR